MSETETPPRSGDVALTPILEAALLELRDLGYHGTTVRKIVARAGLTMPTLYYHYGNKEGVLIALLDLAMDDLQARLDTGLAETADSGAVEQLRALVTAVTLHVTTGRDLAVLHREYRFLGDAAMRHYVGRRDQVQQRLAGVIIAGHEAGVFDVADPHLSVLALTGLLESVADWYRPDGAQTPEQIAEYFAGLSLRMLGNAA
jgi:AcrR family transcriptional regulator